MPVLSLSPTVAMVGERVRIAHGVSTRSLVGQLSGTLNLDDVHAPGEVVVRLRASATDARGARSTSLPAYVCLPGSTAGPCAP